MTASGAAVDQGGDQDAGWDAMRLSALLAATADRAPDRIALADQPGREAWSGRPSIVWSFSFACRIVERLAAYFHGLGLPRGAPVLVQLPNSSELCLTVIALEQAGYTPCLLPAAASEAELDRALGCFHAQAVVTQGVLADTRPAEAVCRVGARHFALRFLCAFGPEVPDGVIDLDRVILEPLRGPPIAETVGETGLATLSRRDGSALYRPCRSLVASAVAFLITAKVGAGDRILSLLAADDHRGLATGLVAALVSGASLECHGLVEGGPLCESLADGPPTHLIAPGWLEPTLAAARLPAGLASVVLVHDAPVRFRSRSALGKSALGRSAPNKSALDKSALGSRPALQASVIDVLAFDELALIAGARDEGGQFSLTLDDDARGAPAARKLLRVRRDPDGAISFAGSGAETRPWTRHGAAARRSSDWTDSGFRADVFAGIVIGVS